MVTIIVTKMDHFLPGEKWPTVELVEADIRKVLKDETDVDRVLFCRHDMSKEELSNAIFNAVKTMPLRKLHYDCAELMEHFGITHKACVTKKYPGNEATSKARNKRRLDGLDEVPGAKRNKNDSRLNPVQTCVNITSNEAVINKRHKDDFPNSSTARHMNLPRNSVMNTPENNTDEEITTCRTKVMKIIRWITSWCC